jgi:two-component system chemotaxis response regulator CheY
VFLAAKAIYIRQCDLDYKGKFMRKKRILVVDDMGSIRQVITALLKSCGYDTVEASSGAMALQLMQTTKFDLVLSDWNMPGMTGTELVTAIRLKDAAIPVVMVTAEADRQRVLEMQSIGVNGYLIKPFKQQSLLTVVAKILPEQA